MCFSSCLCAGVAGMAGTVVQYVVCRRREGLGEGGAQTLGAIWEWGGQHGVSVKGVGAGSHGRIAGRYTGLPGAVAGAHNEQ